MTVKETDAQQSQSIEQLKANFETMNEQLNNLSDSELGRLADRAKQLLRQRARQAMHQALLEGRVRRVDEAVGVSLEDLIDHGVWFDSEGNDVEIRRIGNEVEIHRIVAEYKEEAN